jgi:hypothetical protein
MLLAVAVTDSAVGCVTLADAVTEQLAASVIVTA